MLRHTLATLAYRDPRLFGRLLVAGLRTKEVAYRLGFKQPSHFCRQFRQRHGFAPKVWRLEKQKNAPALLRKQRVVAQSPSLLARGANHSLSAGDNLLALWTEWKMPQHASVVNKSSSKARLSC